MLRQVASSPFKASTVTALQKLTLCIKEIDSAEALLEETLAVDALLMFWSILLFPLGKKGTGKEFSSDDQKRGLVTVSVSSDEINVHRGVGACVSDIEKFCAVQDSLAFQIRVEFCGKLRSRLDVDWAAERGC